MEYVDITDKYSTFPYKKHILYVSKKQKRYAELKIDINDSSNKN